MPVPKPAKGESNIPVNGEPYIPVKGESYIPVKGESYIPVKGVSYVPDTAGTLGPEMPVASTLGPEMPVAGTSTDSPGVYGQSVNNDGVLGEGPVGVYGRDLSGKGNGVIGYSETGRGVWGHSNNTGTGVLGESTNAPGVHGSSGTSDGVLGEGPVGVYGRDLSGKGNGVIGYSDTGRGVWGHSNSGIGVLGQSVSGAGMAAGGVTGGSFEGSFEGVHAVSHHPNAAGVAGYNDNTGAGIYGRSTGGGVAGYFEGNIVVTGNHTCHGDMFLPGADCAEHFDMQQGAAIEPGSVVVIDDDGKMRQSGDAYDRKVAGVISGAGRYKPGIILDKQSVTEARQPVALVGKVYCKVDAQYSPIGVGDMLTSSPTPGHAMKATDSVKAFGAVLGKALGSLTDGTGELPILVCLQ
jgi:hypothetical protein